MSGSSRAIVASTSEGSAGGDDEHDPEGATVAFERQHVAALAAQARGHLAEIDAALRKIDSGTYEICDMCGGPIGAERLAARPASLICVRCAGEAALDFARWAAVVYRAGNHARRFR